jgi:hypothetical protein
MLKHLTLSLPLLLCASVSLAEPIKLPPDQLKMLKEKAAANERAIGGTGSPANPGVEIVIVGELVGKGDSTLQIKPQGSQVEYVVNFPRAYEVAPPDGRTVTVHGMVELVDVKHSRVTLRGQQVDAGEAVAHSHH